MTKSNMTTMYCHKKSSGIIFLNMTETWAPATHCRSPPPPSPPGSSRLHSPFLNVVTWNMEHHKDYMERDRLEQEHHMERGHLEHHMDYMERGHVHHSVLLLPITKLVEDNSDFLPMLCCQNVSQESCFSCKNQMWISRMTNSCFLTWAKLASNYSDWNLSKYY